MAKPPGSSDQLARCLGVVLASHFSHGTSANGTLTSRPSASRTCSVFVVMRVLLACTCSVVLSVKVFIICNSRHWQLVEDFCDDGFARLFFRFGFVGDS